MSAISTSRQLSNKKSYSIFPGNGISQYAAAESPSGERERVFSETTGLAKFSLSPSRASRELNTPKNRGLPVYIPVDQTPEERKDSPASDDILSQYAKKHSQLIELEKQVELVKFELLELSTQIEEKQVQASKQARSAKTATAPSSSVASPSKLNIIKNKASNIFNIQPLQSKQQAPLQDYINKFHSQLNQTTEKIIPRETLKSIVNDVGKNIDENNNKIMNFINNNNTKTTKIFNEMMVNLSPTRKVAATRTPTTRAQVADTSLMFDNLNLNPINLEQSILFDDGEDAEKDEDNEDVCEFDEDLLADGSYSSNIVDIDDYDSEEEEAKHAYA